MLSSNNYAPSEDLAPYVTRFYVFDAQLPEDNVIDTWLFSETPFVRLLIGGDWKSPDENGDWVNYDPALLFGINTRPFPSRVTGPFRTAGFGIRASGWKALFNQPCSDFNDRLFPLWDYWGDIARDLWAAAEDGPDDAVVVAAFENALRRQLDAIGHWQIDQAMAITEYIAHTDSTHGVEELADKVGLSMSQFARRCRATFGLTPKAVMRRARFLDMATAKRGFTHPSEQELAALRFFDDSHMNREFKRYTGMTSRAFDNTPTPLFTPGLKLRAEAHDLRPPDGQSND